MEECGWNQLSTAIRSELDNGPSFYGVAINGE